MTYAAAAASPARHRAGARPSAPPPGAAPGARMAWLDALRGFAALVVAYFHLKSYALDRPAAVFAGWLDLGRYGVLLFFLVSGYVIMMSLERYGSLRRFWVGRIFRIYPAWLLAAAAMLTLAATGIRDVFPALRAHPEAAVLSHLTMLQEFMGVPSLIYVFWTLSYEMVFYLLISGLFVLGLHRRCAWWAVGTAIGGLVLGRLLPDGLFTGAGRNVGIVSALAVVVLAGTVAAYVSGRRNLALVAAVVGIGAGLLPAVNGAPVAIAHADGSWQALTFLTLMLAGTVLHAAQQGTLGRRAAACALATVLACQLAAAWWLVPQPQWGAARVADERGYAVGTLLAVVGTFALGYALRRRRVPAWLAWLGRVSYSVYLLHPIVRYVLMWLVPDAKGRPFAVQLGIGAAYLALTLLAAWASYTWVERPGQKLGKRVTAWLDRRLPPDRCVRPAGAVEVPSARGEARVEARVEARGEARVESRGEAGADRAGSRR